MTALVSDNHGSVSAFDINSGTLTPLSQIVAQKLQAVEQARPAVGAEARELYQKVIAEFGRTQTLTPDQLAQQQGAVVHQIHDAVLGGRVDGRLIGLLRAYARSDHFGEEVRGHAGRLRELLTEELEAVSIAAPREDGPVRVPFTLHLKGKPTTAYLTGIFKEDSKELAYLSRPRVDVGGRSFKICDTALGELASRMGLRLDLENSSQTEVLSRRLGLFTPRAVTYAGGVFRRLTKDDLAGRWQYYHDKFVALEK